MHPTTAYQLATAQITDHHRRGERDQAARAAKRTHRSRQPGPTHRAPRWSARILTRYARLRMTATSPATAGTRSAGPKPIPVPGGQDLFFPWGIAPAAPAQREGDPR